MQTAFKKNRELKATRNLMSQNLITCYISWFSQFNEETRLPIMCEENSDEEEKMKKTV